VHHLDVQSQITFLYYRDLEPAANFYTEILGLEQVVDQGWVRIYRVAGNAFLGIVAGEKGHHAPQERNAVLVTLVVDDAARWYDALQRQGANLLSSLETRNEIGIQCFFLQDPGGYALEVQQFLSPVEAAIFQGCEDGPSGAQEV
jgi:predicted enzyme related to lactoylglutathione lyase